MSSKSLQEEGGSQDGSEGSAASHELAGTVADLAGHRGDVRAVAGWDVAGWGRGRGSRCLRAGGRDVLRNLSDRNGDGVSWCLRCRGRGLRRGLNWGSWVDLDSSLADDGVGDRLDDSGGGLLWGWDDSGVRRRSGRRSWVDLNWCGWLRSDSDCGLLRVGVGRGLDDSLRRRRGLGADGGVAWDHDGGRLLRGDSASIGAVGDGESGWLGDCVGLAGDLSGCLLGAVDLSRGEGLSGGLRLVSTDWGGDVAALVTTVGDGQGTEGRLAMKDLQEVGSAYVELLTVYVEGPAVTEGC